MSVRSRVVGGILAHEVVAVLSKGCQYVSGDRFVAGCCDPYVGFWVSGEGSQRSLRGFGVCVLLDCRICLQSLASRVSSRRGARRWPATTSLTIHSDDRASSAIRRLEVRRFWPSLSATDQ